MTTVTAKPTTSITLITSTRSATAITQQTTTRSTPPTTSITKKKQPTSNSVTAITAITDTTDTTTLIEAGAEHTTLATSYGQAPTAPRPAANTNNDSSSTVEHATHETIASTDDAGRQKGSDGGQIAGGILGTLAVVVLIVGALLLVVQKRGRRANIIPSLHLRQMHAAERNKTLQAEIMADADYTPAFETSVVLEGGHHRRDTIHGVLNNSVHGFSRERQTSVTVSSGNNTLYAVPMEMTGEEEREWVASSGGATVAVAGGNNALYAVPMEMTKDEESGWGATSGGGSGAGAGGAGAGGVNGNESGKKMAAEYAVPSNEQVYIPAAAAAAADGGGGVDGNVVSAAEYAEPNALYTPADAERSLNESTL